MVGASALVGEFALKLVDVVALHGERLAIDRVLRWGVPMNLEEICRLRTQHRFGLLVRAGSELEAVACVDWKHIERGKLGVREHTLVQLWRRDRVCLRMGRKSNVRCRVVPSCGNWHSEARG